MEATSRQPRLIAGESITLIPVTILPSTSPLITMGGTSSRYEFEYVDNDYELVIRVSKALERELTTEFGITGDGLMEKIRELGNHYPGMTSISTMERLVKFRNRLVHDFHVDCLADLGMTRQAFGREFSQASEELERFKPQRMQSSSLVVTRTSSSTADNEASGVGSALMIGGALLAGLAVAAASAGSTCRKCGREWRSFLL